LQVSTGITIRGQEIQEKDLRLAYTPLKIFEFLSIFSKPFLIFGKILITFILIKNLAYKFVRGGILFLQKQAF